MRNFVLVAFVEPVTEGQVFPRTQWPLHITLLRFDVDNAVAEQLAALAGPPAETALGAALTVGEDAGFGRNGSVPVSLVRPQPDLQALHGQLAAAVESAGGRILRPGDTLVLDRVALVDMAPDGNRTVRRILQLWSLPETGAARR